MKAKITFHILSSIASFILLLSLMRVHYYVMKEIVIPQITGSEELSYIYIYSIFFYSWIFPFAIHIVKNYRKHFWVFLSILLTTVLVMTVYELLDGCIERSKWTFCITRDGMVYYYLIQQETLIAALLISTTIYFVQLFVGKKFLPHYYK